MTEVIIPTTKKTKTSKKAQKPIMMNRPTKAEAYNHIHVPTDNEILERSVPMELKYGVKTLVVKCSSLPAKANKDVLEATLNQSVFITNYLNKYLMVNQIAMLNDHFQAVLVYGFHLFNAITQPAITQPLKDNPTA